MPAKKPVTPKGKQAAQDKAKDDSPEPKRPHGGQTKYTQEIADRICEYLMAGLSLRETCVQEDVVTPIGTVLQWVRDDREGFAKHYRRAREIGYHVMAEEILAVANDGSNDYMVRQSKDGEEYEVVNHEHVQRSRLRVDTMKWMLSKTLPKIYGERLNLDHTNSDGSMAPLLEWVNERRKTINDRDE